MADDEPIVSYWQTSESIGYSSQEIPEGATLITFNEYNTILSEYRVEGEDMANNPPEEPPEEEEEE